MDIKRVYEILCDEWEHLSFELLDNDGNRLADLDITTDTGGSSNDDVLNFRSEFNIKKYYDDDIVFEGSIFSNGLICLTFIFDPIERTFHNYEMVNEFNDKTSCFGTAVISTIDDTDFLQLEFTFVLDSDTDAQSAANKISLALEDLSEDDVVEYLQPLTLATK